MTGTDRTEQLIMKNNDNAFGLEGRMDRAISKLLSKDSDIDWSKAPEWATRHGYAGASSIEVWLNDCKYTYCDGQQGGMSFDFCDGWASRKKEEITSITERPSPAWSGEGLPPAGTVCEWREKTGFQWVKATVLFITDCSVVMQRSDGFEWQMMTARTVFRPIRTPEQIAADEREAAIAEIEELIAGYSYRHCAEQIYKAGYRKP